MYTDPFDFKYKTKLAMNFKNWYLTLIFFFLTNNEKMQQNQWCLYVDTCTGKKCQFKKLTGKLSYTGVLG